VFGLPAAGAPRPTRAFEDPVLTAAVQRLVRDFPGVTGVFVQDLVGGAGAAYNARARFPAASTLKLAIAVEVMRSIESPPAPGSGTDALLRRMLVHSDNRAANELEVLLGGSTSGGSARVNALMRALGLTDSEMYGGYIIGTRLVEQRPIPIRVDADPGFGAGKYTTAYDLARLVTFVHLAAGGRGPLVTRLGGAVTPAEARYLLYWLVHSADHGKLDGLLPNAVVAHKSGWITQARHDNGVVYWPGGAFTVTVMTYSRSGVGESSDLLAARVARSALERLRAVANRRGNG
jgi:beta-lactamase class A